jgi:hypothetical protein
MEKSSACPSINGVFATGTATETIVAMAVMIVATPLIDVIAMAEMIVATPLIVFFGRLVIMSLPAGLVKTAVVARREPRSSRTVVTSKSAI